MDEKLFSKCIERVKTDVEGALADIDPRPYISIGGAKTQQPLEVLVREIATDVEVEDIVTNTYMGRSRGGYALTFAVRIECWAKSADLFKSSTAVQEWFARIFAAIAGDKTLDGLCNHAQPFITTTGTSLVGTSYMAAIEGGVRIKTEIDPSIESGE